jgi:hypothetical protein
MLRRRRNAGGTALLSRSLGLNTTLKANFEVLNHSHSLGASHLQLILQLVGISDRFDYSSLGLLNLRESFLDILFSP